VPLGILVVHPADPAVPARRTQTSRHGATPAAPDSLGRGRHHPSSLGPRRGRSGLMTHALSQSFRLFCKINCSNPWSRCADTSEPLFMRKKIS
jgi:hypothetical protein